MTDPTVYRDYSPGSNFARGSVGSGGTGGGRGGGGGGSAAAGGGGSMEPGATANGPGTTLSSYSERDHTTVNEEDVKTIFQAMRHNRSQEVTKLLDRGVPINVKDKFGNTILAVACQNGLKRLAKLALRRGADINSRNFKGNTPLHFCYTYGYGDTLGNYLISKGADATIRNHQGLVCYDGLGGTGKK